MNKVKKLVISKKRYDYLEFEWRNTLDGIKWRNVDCLIYCDSVEPEVKVSLELSRLGDLRKSGKGPEKLVYINENINPIIFSLFAGMDADIYNNDTCESMLEDEETLEYLLAEYKNTGFSVPAGNLYLEKLSEFVNTVSKESGESLEKLKKNALWLKSLEETVSKVETSLVRTDDVNVGLVEMFNKTSQIIGDLQDKHENLTGEIESLSEELKKAMVASGNTGANTLYRFPTYTVPNVAPKTLYIRCYGPCRYLMSFLIAYQHYLKMAKQKTSKILLAVPPFPLTISRYSNLTRLAKETIDMPQIFKAENEVFVTTEPTHKILSSFFNVRVDLMIVVDMFYGDVPLLQGAKVLQMSGVSGISDIKRYNLQPTKCFISTFGPKASLVMPHIPGFVGSGPESDTNVGKNLRINKYAERCMGADGLYSKLDKILGM